MDGVSGRELAHESMIPSKFIGKRRNIKGAAYVSVFSVADSNRKRRQSDINCVPALYLPRSIENKGVKTNIPTNRALLIDLSRNIHLQDVFCSLLNPILHFVRLSNHAQQNKLNCKSF